MTHDTNVVFRIDRWVRSVGACRERANAGPHTGELRPRSYGCRVFRDWPHGFWRGVTPLWLLWFVVFRTGTFSAAIRRRRLNHCVLRRWNSKHRRQVRARLGIPDGYPVRRLLLRQDSPCWCVGKRNAGTANPTHLANWPSTDWEFPLVCAGISLERPAIVARQAVEDVNDK